MTASPGDGDGLSDDELSGDELSGDELSDDELSDDELSDDELSGDSDLVGVTARELSDAVLEAGDPRLAEPPYVNAVLELCRRAARHLIRSNATSQDKQDMVAAVASEALLRGLRSRAHELLDAMLAVSSVDSAVASTVRAALDRAGAVELDDPDRWVVAAVDIEQRRETSPDGIVEDQLRAEMAAIRDAINHDRSVAAFTQMVCGDQVDPGDVRHDAVERVVKRFRNADRRREGSVVEAGKERAYAKAVIRRTFLTHVGRHREVPVDVTAAEPDGLLLLAPSVEDTVVGLVDLKVLVAQVVQRSYSAPGLLGPAYTEQWSMISNANARRSVARRFAIAAVLIAGQRRSNGLMASGMIEGLRRSLDDDDGLWLMSPVNRTLSQLQHEWGQRYANRLPRDAKEAADKSERTDYAALLRDCQGQTDTRRPSEGHSEFSVRQHGTSALMHLVFGDAVKSWIEADR